MKETIYPFMSKLLQESSSSERGTDCNGEPFNLAKEMEIFAVSAILYHIAHTHEFDELPVRHNEEYLNLELSKKLPWRHDMAFKQGRSNETNSEALMDSMKDPHTK